MRCGASTATAATYCSATAPCDSSPPSSTPTRGWPSRRAMAGRWRVATEVEVADERRQRERYVLLILAGVVVALVVAFALYYWLSRPPQMGTNEEVFKT